MTKVGDFYPCTQILLAHHSSHTVNMEIPPTLCTCRLCKFSLEPSGILHAKTIFILIIVHVLHVQ